MHDFWRVVHILSAIVWAGGTIVVTLFVTPTAKKIGDDGRPFMQALVRTNMTAVLLGAAISTVVAGGFLYWERFDGISFTGTSGLWISIGALAGITALAIGYTFGARSTFGIRRLGAGIAKRGGPPTAEEMGEMQRLQSRLTAVGPFLLVLFVIAIFGMALGA
ncbi:MAG: hypothetical protein WB245_13230 [Acidimicrobiia bacterium]